MMTLLESISESACARSGNSRSASSNSSPTGRGRLSSGPCGPAARLKPFVGKPVEEAAWQLLKPFINPIDCNWYLDFTADDGTEVSDVFAMNTNETLNRLFNGEEVKLRYFSKRRFCDHCQGGQKYYYRGAWNSYRSIGYGNGPLSHERLNFDAARYGLACRKSTDKSTGQLLLGLDVDAHHGERDVAKTVGLILEYFPKAYVEPSTRGCHVFVKIQYPVAAMGGRMATLQYLGMLFEFVKEVVERNRISRGYDAPLDVVAGLPTVIGEVDGRLKVIKRTKVIRMPFHGAANWTSIDRFHDSPWYSMADLKDLVLADLVIEEEQIERNLYQPSPRVEDALKLPILIREDDEQEDDPWLILPTATTTTSLSTPNRAYPSVRLTYAQVLDDLKAIDDSRQRRLEFGLLLARQIARIPTAAELKAAYVEAGVYRPTSASDNDDHRYKQLVKVIAKGFDPAKACFNYDGYRLQRQAMGRWCWPRRGAWI